MQDISITEVRARLGELVDRLRYTGEGVLLTKSGKPASALVPAQIYAEWARRRGALATLVEKMRNQVAASGLTDEEVTALVNEMVDEVRADSPRSVRTAG